MLHEMHCGHMWNLSASLAWASVRQGKLRRKIKTVVCSVYGYHPPFKRMKERLIEDNDEQAFYTDQPAESTQHHKSSPEKIYNPLALLLFTLYGFSDIGRDG